MTSRSSRPGAALFSVVLGACAVASPQSSPEGGLAVSRLEENGGRDASRTDGSEGERSPGASPATAQGPTVSEVAHPAVVRAGDTVSVSWRVRDPQGLADDGGGRSATWVRIGGASGWVNWCEFTLSGERVEGDSVDGRYEARCAVPATAVDGRYGLWFGASSLSGTAFFSEEATSFDVVGGATDADVPVVTEVAVSPEEAAPGGLVTLSWRATDATGVAYIVPWAMGPNGRFVDDAGSLWLAWGTPTLVSGDALDGRYEVTLALSASAVEGRYALWFSRGDVLGNRDIATVDTGAGADALVVAIGADGDAAVTPGR